MWAGFLASLKTTVRTFRGVCQNPQCEILGWREDRLLNDDVSNKETLLRGLFKTLLGVWGLEGAL